jgi:hypothetical protein
MKVSIAIFAVAAILATTGVMTTATQQALADKVGPKPGENNVDQGALGEYFSKDGRDYYADGELNGVGTSGKQHGQATQTYARPDTTGGTCDINTEQCSHESYDVRSLGDNFAFYASGECHDPTPDPQTPCE